MAANHLNAIPAGLPSRVEETFAACPQFRIVVIGKSGVGKSSLVSSVFNISLNSEQIDIAHGRAGSADIEKAYSSEENPRFILHDSMGFEHGSTENWSIVEKFLRDRTSRAHLKEHVHAIWLCLETPRTGSRIMETGDEDLLTLAKNLRIPVIVVFTKYDILVNEHLRKIPEKISPEKRQAARMNAESYFTDRVQDFKSKSLIEASCVKVSTKKTYLQETLLRLTDLTRETLHDVEGELWVPWAAAQHISARQKVELSISEGFKKYWINLGVGAVFRGHRLLDCIARIHCDIISVWNFNDPLGLLSGNDFKAKMIRLVEPLLIQHAQGSRSSEYSAALSAATALGSAFALVLAAVGISAVAINFLYQTYRGLPSTARYLGAYIVDLTLVLHLLFMETLAVQPPRALTEEYISCALENYEHTESASIHKQIGDLPMSVNTHFEEPIAALIRKSLNFD